MRKLFFAFLGILLLAITAVLVAPYLVDWNAQKPRIVAELRELTGRDLEISGDLSLAVIPTPRLSVEGLSIANLPEGSAEPLLEVGKARVEVAILPLISGDIQVRSVTLLRPRLLLEVLPDGRPNWEFKAEGADTAAQAPSANQSQSQSQPGSSGGGPEISLDRVQLRDGTVIYRDLAHGWEERVEEISADLSARSLRGPLTAKGRASPRGIPVNFNLNLGAVDGSVPLGIALELPEAGAARLTYSGTVNTGQPFSARGRLEARGEDLAALIGVFAPDLAARERFAEDFSIKATVDYDQDVVDVRNLELSLLSVTASGTAEILTKDIPDVRVDLLVPRLDLDGFLARAEAPSAGQPQAPQTQTQEGAPAAPDSAPAPGSTQGQEPDDQPAGAFSLPEDIAASLDLRISALIYKGQVIRQTGLSARLEKGELAVNDTFALLPGGADVSGGGVLRARDGEPVFTGRIEASADNLRRVLSWLGIDPEAVPPDRLRRLTLVSGIEATPREILFKDIAGEVDTSRFAGGIAIAPRERVGLGIGLTVDRLNLDGYLPPADGGGGGGQDAEAPAPGGGANALEAFDANFDLRVGELVLHNQPARDLHLDATLRGGVLRLRKLTAGDLAGAEGQVAGVFYGLPDLPRVEDGSFELKVADARRFARFVGQPTDGALHRLGPFTAAGTFAGSLESFVYNLDLAALGGSLLSSGQVSGLSREGFAPESLRVEEGRIDVAGLESKRLAAYLRQPGDGLLARLGPLDVSSQFSGSLTDVHYDTVIALSGGRFAFQGSTKDLDSGIPEVDLRADLAHPDLPGLLDRVMGSSPLPPGYGALDLTSRVTGTPLRFAFSEMQGTVGPTTLAGNVEAEMLAARPKVVADLDLGEVDLKRPTAGGGGGGQSGGSAQRWSRERLDLSGLQAVDADLKLRLAKAVYEELEFRDTDIEASLDAAKLDLSRLSSRVGAGAILASGSFDGAGQVPSGQLELTATEVDLGPVLEAAADFERLSGPLTVKANLGAQGASEAALVRSLAGQVTLLGNLRLKLDTKERVGGALLGALGEQLGQKLDKRGLGNLAGASGLLGVLAQAFLNDPARLSGSLQLRDGVATTQDARLDGTGATARFRGTVADLPAWATDLNIDLARPGERQPFAKLVLAGPLDRPLPRSLDQPHAAPQPEPTPADPGKQPVPKDILKDSGKRLLQDLLKGIQ